jgi:hypothetical protein
MMSAREIIAVGWNNGSRHASGAGYGLKLTPRDRDSCLIRKWGFIELYLPGDAETARVIIDKDSLWNGTCRELIHKKIGAWLIRAGLATWPKGQPPQVRLTPRTERTFEASLI